MRKLAPQDSSHYLRAVRQSPAYRAPTRHGSVEDLRRYQLHLVDHGISPVSLNAAISGLEVSLRCHLDHAELMARMQPVRVPRTCR